MKRFYLPSVKDVDCNTITIKIDPLRVKRGHQPHNSGSGVHADRRVRRQNTRSAQLRKALKDTE
jgi:hypothetical protein